MIRLAGQLAAVAEESWLSLLRGVQKRVTVSFGPTLMFELVKV